MLTYRNSIIATLALLGVGLVFTTAKWMKARGERRTEANEQRREEVATPPQKKEKKRKSKKDAIQLVKEAVGVERLYDIPWYLLIGPSQSGKTTLLTSELNPVPYRADSFDCYHYGEQAVIFDTKGNYVTQSGNKTLNRQWLRRLRRLKKHRREMPIDGVLVAVAIDSLLKFDECRIAEEAIRIRQRIRQVIKKLGIVFPIYLIFTKCDLLYGFVPFFAGNGDPNLRLGCSLTKAQQEKPGDAFMKECALIDQRLNSWRIVRLISEKNPKASDAIYLFPVEFNLTYPQLKPFVENLFDPKAFREKPIFRGFYFTSGTQESGKPVEFVIQRRTRDLQIPWKPPEPPRGKQCFFIKNLWNEVIFPDQTQNLVRPIQWERWRRRFLQIIKPLAVILALCFFLYVLIAQIENCSNRPVDVYIRIEDGSRFKSVKVDGKTVDEGMKPHAWIPIPKGTHTIEVQLEDGEVISQEERITEERPIQIRRKR